MSIYNRIITAMKYYSNINQNEEKTMNFVTNIYKSLLNDFIHTQYHNHQINEIGFNDHQIWIHSMHFIMSFLINHYNEHKQNKEKKDENDSEEFIFYKDVLNTIHCFIFHSYDLGLRLTAEQFENTDHRQTQHRSSFNPERFSTNKYNLKMKKEQSQYVVQDQDLDQQTYIDKLIDYISRRQKHRNLAQSLLTFLHSEEYDTDALIQDMDINDTDQDSNLRLKFKNTSRSSLDRTCICGDRLVIIPAIRCYNGRPVACDLCRLRVEKTENVYHCANGHTEIHKSGYDVCNSCIYTLFHEENVFDMVKYYAQTTRC